MPLGQGHLGTKYQSEETLARAHRLFDNFAGDNPSIRSPQSHHTQQFSACLSQRRCLSPKLRMHRELLNEPDANPVSLGVFGLELQVARRAKFVPGPTWLGQASVRCRRWYRSVMLCWTTYIPTWIVSSVVDMRLHSPPSNKNHKERRQKLFMTPEEHRVQHVGRQTLGPNPIWGPAVGSRAWLSFPSAAATILCGEETESHCRTHQHRLMTCKAQVGRVHGAEVESPSLAKSALCCHCRACPDATSQK